MAEPKFFSAARGLIKFRGIKIATCQGITWNENVGRRRVGVVGELKAQERTAVSVDAGWSIQFVKTVKLDERQLGLVGSRKAVDLIKEEPFTIEIFDKGTSPPKVQYTLVECVYGNGSWNLPSGDILTGSISGEANELLHASES